jgi:cellulose synthase/poly-beta-1,6-N-acetylglucosamine synthase-like glycosyltransferase
MALMLIAGGLVCVGLALHPFITYPLSLLVLRRFHRVPIRASEQAPAPGEIAICVCAYNEEQVIASKIANLLALQQRYPGLAVLVYVDAASDRTLALLEPYADRIELHVGAQRRGKTHGMSRLVAATDKPILLFTDANVLVDLDAPDRLVRYFADPDVGCVCGHLRYTNAAASATAATGSLYWRLEERIKWLETQTGSAMGADGSLFAVRRAAYRVPPEDLIDDMFVSLMVLCDGSRIVQAQDVVACEASATACGEEFQRKIRIACQAFNVHRALWPRLSRLSALSIYKYVSHKWLRWSAIFFLTAGALLLACGLWTAGHAIWVGWLAAAASACLLAGYLGWAPALASLWNVLSALAGAGIGVLRSLRGDRFQTWTPAASVRE